MRSYRAAHLRSEGSHEVLKVGPDERVLEDGAAVRSQHLFKLVDAASLVRVHEARHRLDLGVCAVWLCLLRVERIHVALHQHRGEDKVLEALYPAPRAMATSAVLTTNGHDHKTPVRTNSPGPRQQCLSFRPAEPPCHTSGHAWQPLRPTPRAFLELGTWAETGW